MRRVFLYLACLLMFALLAGDGCPGAYFPGGYYNDFYFQDWEDYYSYGDFWYDGFYDDECCYDGNYYADFY